MNVNELLSAKTIGEKLKTSNFVSSVIELSGAKLFL